MTITERLPSLHHLLTEASNDDINIILEDNLLLSFYIKDVESLHLFVSTYNIKDSKRLIDWLLSDAKQFADMAQGLDQAILLMKTFKQFEDQTRILNAIYSNESVKEVVLPNEEANTILRRHLTRQNNLFMKSLNLHEEAGDNANTPSNHTIKKKLK